MSSQTLTERMRRRGRRTRAEILKDAPPIEAWPEPDMAQMAASELQKYRKRRLAVDLYVRERRCADITEKTGLPFATVHRIVERCLEVNPLTKEIWGFHACVPNARAKGTRHLRRTEFNEKQIEQGRGLKGALGAFFTRHPYVEEALVHLIRHGNVPGEPVVSRVTVRVVIDAFHGLCRRNGVGLDEWPFNVKSHGTNAIRDWYQTITARYAKTTVGLRFGDEAAALATLDYATINKDRPVVQLPEYARVEIDEHRLDGRFLIGVPTPSGSLQYVVFRRIWILAAVLTGSDAVLAATVCYGEGYSTEDVLTLLRRAVSPPPRRTLTLKDPEFRYREGAAFPAELPEFKGNRWMELAWDGHSTHIAVSRAAEQFHSVLGGSVVMESVGQPARRRWIEGFFGRIASDARTMANTTGSHPRSRERRDPDKAALEMKFYAVSMEEILDVVCRNHNATASTACGGLSPLEYLRERNLRGEAFICPIDEVGQNKLYRLLPRFPAKLTHRRGPKNGGPLRVHLMGVSYSSKELAYNERLHMTSNPNVDVYVEEDARYAFVVPQAFPELVFRVRALGGQWAALAHPIAWRRLAVAAVKHCVEKDHAMNPNAFVAGLRAVASAAADEDPKAPAILAKTQAYIAQVQADAVPTVMSKEEVQTLREEIAELAEEGDFSDDDSIDEGAGEGRFTDGLRRADSGPNASALRPLAVKPVPRGPGSDPFGLRGGTS